MIRSFAFLFVLMTSGFAFSQTAEVTIDTLLNCTYTGQVSAANFPTHDFSGEVIEIGPNGSELMVEMYIVNLTGVPQDWNVSRRRINVDASWDDFLVYGALNDVFGGVAISGQTMDYDMWTAPFSSIFVSSLDDMDTMHVIPHIFPGTEGCGTYRYYVGTELDPLLDSVDIQVCHYLDTEEITNTIDAQVYPNPVSDVLQIKADVSEASLTIVDVLGREVMSQSFSYQAVINIGELANNVYFVIIEKEGILPIKKKIVIQH